jgi:saccharopine dehydrogenase (NADP+, L-glutamate forming)
MKIIDNVHSRGGKVDDFYSMCGALPAPEAADNPFRYKFSWSPLGVIQASKNSALYLKDGKKIITEGEKLFTDRFETEFPGIGPLEVYPNRDSISYIDIYGIPETKTIFRGTFRFPGWCESLDLMKSINMLDDNVRNYSGFTYSDFIKERAGISDKDLTKGLCKKLDLNENDNAMKALEWLGFFADTDMGHTLISPFGITSGLMISKMSLKKDERDMIVLQHIVHTSYPDGRKEIIKASLVDFGIPATNTAVARTVALPAAIATKLILTGKIILPGVHRPVKPEIYHPVIHELEKLGIKMNEEITVVN